MPLFLRPLKSAQIWWTHRWHESHSTHGSSCMSSFFFFASSFFHSVQSGISSGSESLSSLKHCWHQWYWLRPPVK